MHRCEVCQTDWQVGVFNLCQSDRDKLIRLLENSEAISFNSLKLKNVKLTTDIMGTPYIVALDGTGASGWQRPFGVDGQGKCIVCDELADPQQMVCGECRGAMMAYRQGDEPRYSKVMAFLELAGTDAFEKWMMNELERMGRSGDDDQDRDSAGGRG